MEGNKDDRSDIRSGAVGPEEPSSAQGAAGRAASIQTERGAVVIAAGVLARGIRPCGHVAFRTTMEHLHRPLVEQGYNVQLWGFNNIPTTIDGDPVPADGGESAFPVFDYYEQYMQDDIDTSPCMPRRHEWFDRTVFLEVGAGGHHIRWDASWRNLLRYQYAYERAEAKLRREHKVGALGHKDMVVLVYPEMLIAPQRSTLFQELDAENVIGTCNCTDGVVIGRLQSVLKWFDRMNSPSAPSAYFEAWFGASLSSFARRKVELALPSRRPSVTALQKRGLREWIWAVEGYGRHPALEPRININASTRGRASTPTTHAATAWELLPRDKRTEGDISVCAFRDGVRLRGCYLDTGRRSLMTTLFHRLSAAWRRQKVSAFVRWKRLLTSPSGLRSAID